MDFQSRLGLLISQLSFLPTITFYFRLASINMFVCVTCDNFLGRAPKNVQELEEGLPAAAFAQCPNPARIRLILRECYSLLAVDGDANPTLEQRLASGWSAAYSLHTWLEFPGIIDVCQTS